MSTLSSYLVTCLTEGVRVVTNYSFEPPTTCPNNTSHTIDPSQTVVYDTQSLVNVSVVIPDGYYQCCTLDLDMPVCSPGSVYTKEISWPMKIYLWTISLYLPADSEGDSYDVISAPDTAIGYLTSGVDVGATQISVSETVTANMIPGLDIDLYDGVNRNVLGRITACDSVNHTVTFETATTNSFTQGTIVLFNLKNIRNFDVCRNIASEVHLATAWVKYKEVPANTIMRIVYHNNNGGAKCIAMKVEYYIMPAT